MLLLPHVPYLPHAEAEPRTQQRCWLLECVQQLWGGFHQRFAALWREHGAGGDACSAALFDAGTAEVRFSCGRQCRDQCEHLPGRQALCLPAS